MKTIITMLNFGIIDQTEEMPRRAGNTRGAAAKGLVSMQNHDTPNDNLIPYGYCHCGCGRRTKIASQNNTRRRNRKGEYLRYFSPGCSNKHRGKKVAAKRAPFPHPAYQGVSCVPLAAGGVALIDDEDLDKVVGYSWARATGDYATTKVDRKTTFLHRVVMAAPDGMQVDHVDGNTLDNRKKNLRIATHAQNQMNRGPFKGKTLPKGVHRYGDRYRALIRQSDSRTLYLGTFDTPEEAAIAYDDAAVRLHGEFAWLNYPKTGS